MLPAPLVNAFQRRLDNMFGGAFRNRKHDHYKDFGWPESVSFNQLYRMYTRNGIAASAVDKTIAKTWQDNPEVWESEEAKESKLEAVIRQRFEDLRIWQGFAEADRRSLVGPYSGLILRFADNQPLKAPLGRVNGGLNGLVGVVPVWSNQLRVSKVIEDVGDEDYGKPAMYSFEEADLTDNTKVKRTLEVHPDRVIIFSDDGTVSCRSALEPGYNDLIDAEKVKGAGGEGFWKSARGAPIIEAPEGMKPEQVAKMMGVEPSKMLDAINQQIDDFNQGFDKGMMLGGMTAKTMQISLPSPEHFLAGPINSFAASFQIPVKILLGSQTGERASTEDSREWNQTNNSRRVNRCRPIIKEFLNRLEACGVLPPKDWSIGWQDLTEASSAEKLERASKMSMINTQTQPGDIPAFTPNEIREAAGFKPDPELDADAEDRVSKPPPEDDDDAVGEDDQPPPGEEQEDDPDA